MSGDTDPVPRRRLVVGNWKMNGSRRSNAALLGGIRSAEPFECEVAVCAPFPYLEDVRQALEGSASAWGTQDCSAHAHGAYTGEVAASMLAEFGCRYCIVGHSERRRYHGEGDVLVADKAAAALATGVAPIVCVGETLAEHDAGATADVVSRQLRAVIEALGERVGFAVVAYEPVWAIGTGRTATPAEAQQVHALLRAQLAAAGAGQARLLYGGSVKPDNAAALFEQADIDGGLIGGASLNADDFVAICRAVRAA